MEAYRIKCHNKRKILKRVLPIYIEDGGEITVKHSFYMQMIYIILQ